MKDEKERKEIMKNEKGRKERRKEGHIEKCCEVIIWSKFGGFKCYYLVQVGVFKSYYLVQVCVFSL